MKNTVACFSRAFGHFQPCAASFASIASSTVSASNYAINYQATGGGTLTINPGVLSSGGLVLNCASAALRVYGVTEVAATADPAQQTATSGQQ